MKTFFMGSSKGWPEPKSGIRRGFNMSSMDSAKKCRFRCKKCGLHCGHEMPHRMCSECWHATELLRLEEWERKYGKGPGEV